MLPGHHRPHPTLLSLGPGLIQNQNHRLTLGPIQLQSHRRRILIVRGHVHENGMRGVGGHEDAASHTSHLVIVTAVTARVPGIDASVITRSAAMLPPFVLSESLLYRICALQYTILRTTSVAQFVKATMRQRSSCKSIQKWWSTS